MKITFLGAGAYGTALADVARYNGHTVSFYDPIKYPEIALKTSIAGADAVVYVAPSSVSAEILPNLDVETPLICASKGFLSLAPFARFKNFSVLAGAAYADDIKKALADLEKAEAESEKAIPESGQAQADSGQAQAETVITLTATSSLSEQLFSTENLKIEYTNDNIGVLLSGALKNVYAIGAGLYGEELEPSEKTSSIEQTVSVSQSYLESALSEMIQIIEQNGGEKSTLKLSCGAKDLVLSCDYNSRNFRLGRALRSESSTEITAAAKDGTVEGLAIINSLAQHPDFILPKSATLFADIVAAVKSANLVGLSTTETSADSSIDNKQSRKANYATK